MAKKPNTVCPETGMMHAATVMLNRRISCLPVVDAEESDRVLGILTLTDMLLGLNCLLPVIEGIAEQLAAIERSEAGERATEATDKAAELVRELRG
jgi:CBS-domain-containing membrane protein